MDRRATDRRRNSDNTDGTLDINAILHTLWRRKLVLTALFTAFLIPIALFVAFKPSIYKATTSVMLENQELNLTDFQDALPKADLNDMSVETQGKVISSPKLVHQTLDALDADETKKNPEQRHADLISFLNSMSVDTSGKSRVIEISYRSEDPVEAAERVNAHANQYVEYQAQNKKEQIASINSWISEQVETLKKESQEKSQAIQEYRNKSGIVLGKNSQDLLYQQIADLMRELAPVETTKLNLQARVEALENAKSQDAALDVTQSSLINSLKNEASLAKQELQSLNANYGPNHPTLIAAKRKVAQVNSDIAREVNLVKTSLRTQLEAAQKQEALLRTRLEELNKQSDEWRDQSIALESLEAEQTANRTMLANFMARAEEVKSQIGLNRAGAKVVSPAEIPLYPVGNSKIVMLVLGILFAATAAVVIIFLLELVDRGIERAEDIKKILNLRLIGTLPRTKNPLTALNDNNRSPYMEEIKRIYLQLAEKETPQSILVTASRNGEGKSTVALSLAQYLASINQKVVLVDANTVSPSIAQITGVEQSPGFNDIITGTTKDHSKTIKRTNHGYSVIASGNDNTGTDLMASDKIVALIENLKSQYSYVIIDCANVGETTDAEIIASLSDQVIFVIEGAKTPLKLIKNNAETLRRFSKTTPNVILNKQA